MTTTYDVLVIGGGIVGLASALAMSQRNASVALIDAGSLEVNTEQMDQRVYAINQTSMQLFQELGVWEHISKSRCSPYQHMHVWDAINGAAIDFDSRLVAADRLGAIIEESIIKEALLLKIRAQDKIDLFSRQKVDDLQTSENSVRVWSKEQSWQGQLLMVSDGANSPSRDLLKVPLTSWSYKQEAIVATVETEKSHQQTAWQVFHSNGPLAFLPLSHEKHCSIVWSTSPSEAKQLMAESDEVFNQALTKAFAEKLGAVKLLSQRHQFPLTMRHAKQYSGHRWLLLGDAAHTIHPLAGLGLNVGLSDLSSWLDKLEALKDPSKLQRALASYQRERKADVWKVILLMESLKHLFANPLPPVQLIRGLGLRWVNQMTPLKRMLIQQAMGE